MALEMRGTRGVTGDDTYDRSLRVTSAVQLRDARVGVFSDDSGEQATCRLRIEQQFELRRGRA